MNDQKTNPNRTSTDSTAQPARRAFLVCTLVLLLAAGVNAQAKIKCWTNHEGVRECGNSVPPEFMQKGFEEKSVGGVTLDRKGKARTLEDVEREKLEKIEAIKAAAAVREQDAKDRVLLDTFSSEDDMVLARDGQIAHLNSQVKITESHMVKLDKSLNDLIGEAADFERRGSEPPEKLVGDIQSLRTQIKDNQRFIDAKALERKTIDETFSAYIARFRALKGITSVDPH